MPRLARVFLLLALAVRPAAAGSILFATAASDSRIDGFCLTPGGAFADPPTPVRQFGLATAHTRRIIFVPEDRAGQPDAGTLYVAEVDRVEAFRIGPNGNLAKHCGTGSEPCIGQTEVGKRVKARTLAVDSISRTLYVAERGFDRITSYPLDDAGLPVLGVAVCAAGDNAGNPCKRAHDCPKSFCQARFSSCIQGRIASGYEDMVVRDGRVYVSAEAGRVDIFGTAPDGRLCTCAPCAGLSLDECEKLTCALGDPCIPTTAAECPAGKTVTDVRVTPTLLERRGLSAPTTLFVTNGLLYVQETGIRRLAAFRLDQLRPQPARVCKAGDNPGQPCSVTKEATECPKSVCAIPRVCHDGPNLGSTCTTNADCPDSKCRHVAPKAVTRTNQVLRYLGMQLFGSTILGTQSFRGRIDAFRLQEPKPKLHCDVNSCPASDPQCCLPRTETVHSNEDLRMSPVGLTVAPARDGPVLYVAAGEDDRVRAYRLDSTGLLQTLAPFSETAEQKGSFPNDVAVAVLPSGCQ